MPFHFCWQFFIVWCNTIVQKVCGLQTLFLQNKIQCTIKSLKCKDRLHVKRHNIYFHLFPVCVHASHQRFWPTFIEFSLDFSDYGLLFCFCLFCGLAGHQYHRLSKYYGWFWLMRSKHCMSLLRELLTENKMHYTFLIHIFNESPKLFSVTTLWTYCSFWIDL